MLFLNALYFEYVLGWVAPIFNFGDVENDHEFLAGIIYPEIRDEWFIPSELAIFPVLVVNGLRFSGFVKSEYSETFVGFSDDCIVKIEQVRCDNKLNDLQKSCEILRHLNDCGCVSCPRLLSEGFLESGQRYCIQERIKPVRDFNYADMIFSIREQKYLGVCQGDFKRDNLVFAANGICVIIDYDQAMLSNRFIELSNIAYFAWFEGYFKGRWKFDIDYYTLFGYDYLAIDALFRDGSFNLAATTVMQRQVTTDTDSGLYPNFFTPAVFIEGARSFAPRIKLLDNIKFKRLETVLDVGCNLGLLGHYLTDRGCIVTGVDMDPMIVKAAKMVANIVRKSIRFEQQDVDKEPISEFYDTICLFSVLHHAGDCAKVAQNVAQHCRRIVVESRLHEVGSKFVGGKWVASGGWSCVNVSGVIDYLKDLFIGFKLDSYVGICDRDRHILTFTRAHV